MHSGKLSSILFHERLCSIFRQGFGTSRNYKLFVTGTVKPNEVSDEDQPGAISALKAYTDYIGEGKVERRRFEEMDLLDAIGPVENRGGVVAYVCGPPPMTDWAVSVLKGAEGMQSDRVLCEKWW
jgi:NAD(P)H-flavin reductase